MTIGLLTSRRTKSKLFAKAVSEPNVVNKNRSKQYKSIYQRTIRAAKKLHISDTLRENANNQKKIGKPSMRYLVKIRNLNQSRK
jgi:hypothetical protein